MKKAPPLLIFIFLSKLMFAQNVLVDSVDFKYAATIEISTNDFNKLLPLIIQPGRDDQEKLKLVYYWIYQHITFDTDRFLQLGPLQPQEISETLKSGKGMCYEYNDLIDAACKYLKIPGYKVEGYVKYYGFETATPFTENNHIWYALNIDGKWKMIDMLWACGTISFKGSNCKFNKKLHTEYFLATPADFFGSHLPADPVWQFDNRPLSMSGFISKKDGVDSAQHYIYINYADSIVSMSKFSGRENELKSALRAFNFNPENPNQLIVTCYNYAVYLVNNPKATRKDLVAAKSYFTKSKLLIPSSRDDNIKQLLPVCEKGITSVENRLRYIK